jgi:glycosyltransferase involved in cell wall biosynthesis
VAGSVVERDDRAWLSPFRAHPEDVIDHQSASGAAGKAPRARKIGMLGNHTPRQCGIATFTADLCDAIAVEEGGVECVVLAMNDEGKRHAYPPRVRFEIAEGDLASYRRAADFLNVNAVDVVSVQHEYGIFGGRAGSHVLALLRGLRMPVVTTLHTILAEPSPPQRQVMDELTRISERIVVMSAHGAELLRDVHGVSPDKIDHIHHGIPGVPFPAGSKHQLGVEGQHVILTFGLLSPDKGIEYVIDAMPKILEQYPNTVYIVLGATHPHIREQHGETYRLMLEARAQRLGVASRMIFHNRFVSQQELAEFLSGADIYVTPYLKPEQMAKSRASRPSGSCRPERSTEGPFRRQRTDASGTYGSPWASATGSQTTDPSTTLTPRPSAGSARTASFQPWSAISSVYGSVALTSAWVEVCGTAPGMLATQ